MDSPTLQASIDDPNEVTRVLLFSHLANSKAAVRAKAAEGLLKLYATASYRPELARDFGREPAAILTSVLDELRAVIGEPRTPAWTRFLSSMNQDYAAWRDGIGYDYSAVLEMSEPERGALREMIRTRLGDRIRPADWRDVELAHAMQETAAIAELTTHQDATTRLRSKLLMGTAEDVAAEIVSTLRENTNHDAVSRALDYVPSYATDDVKDALVARVRKVDSNFINAAMVLLAVYGGVQDTWAERPFLFQLQTDGPGGTLMQKLLSRVRAG